MNDKSVKNLPDEYAAALESYFQGGAEAALDQAYEVGRAAIEQKLGVLELTRIHQEALEAIMTNAPSRQRSTRWVRMASDVLSEALGPFEMTQRGYQETLEQLRRFNQSLEQQIFERTRDLKAAEEKYRTLFENNPMPMWVYDLETLAFLAVNDAAVRHYGYSQDEFLAMTLREIHPEEEVPRLLEQLVQREYATNISGPWKHRKKSGELIYVEIYSHPITFGDRKAVLSLADDVTEKVHRERELQAIAAMSYALRDAQTRAEILPLLLDQPFKLMQVDAAALVMCDSDHVEMTIELARGAWEGLTGQNLSPIKEVCQTILGAGQPYLNNNVGGDPRFAPFARSAALHAMACIPLISQKQVIGALWVASETEIDEDEVRLMTAICDITASAIQRATLFEQTQQRLQRIAALHAIDVAISSSLDINLTLDVVITQAINQLGVDAADIYLLNAHMNRLEFGAGHGFPMGIVRKSHLRLDEGPAGRAVLERRVISISDLSESDLPFVHAVSSPQTDFRAYYCAPLISKGQVKGVLEVLNRTPLKTDPEWLTFLETLAGQAAIAIDDAELFKELQRSNLELSLAYDATIEGWSRALDLRDKETEGHTQRVTEMTERLARAMGVEDADLIHIRRGSLLHDIGKMGVPDNILLKPGPLTEEEWVIMRKHPVFAYEMLEPIHYLRPALDIPYCHHEKWDGTGYPRGLKGEEIPLPARIFAVVDVWDALSSDRPYRPAWPEKKVIEYIREQTNKHFDPRVVEVFLEILRSG